MSFGPAYDAKEQVRQAVDIVDVVSGYVQLRRNGRNFVGLCPWHDDSRPSLQVNPERQSFKCWVCDIGGDVFNFVMKAEGMEFREALEMLAEGTESDTLPPKPVMLWGSTRGHFPPASDEEVALHTETADEPIATTINGEFRFIHGANGKTLLRLIREDAGLIGTKEGCAEGECGACTVFLDGIAVMTCLVPAPRAHNSQITTLEGLAQTQKTGAGDEVLHPVQQAFINEGAVQCGYCTPGFLMSGASLMAERKRPTRDEIKQAITGNLCRCTGYYKILQALEKAYEIK